jgi:DNA-binding CsgD family transcriptional regulator
MSSVVRHQSAPRLLDRETEVAEIRRLVELTRDGSGRTIAFQGSAGMGKTRLLQETRSVAEGAGFDVLAARGGELEHEFGYGVVRQLFEPRLATLPDEARAEVTAGAAALALPIFEGFPAAGGPAGMADTSFAMLHGLYWLTANLALRRPTVVAVDDLHWADRPSLRWIAYLARRLDGLPLLLAVATRPPRQSPEAELLTEVLTDPDSVVVRPVPLGPDAIASLVTEQLGPDPAPEFVSACQAATGGNPLFLRALLAALGRDRVAPAAASAPRVLKTGPEEVSRAVALRLARLPAQMTAVIRAAAVLGDGQPLRRVGQLAGLKPETVARAATALVRSDLLRQENPVEFAHPIVRTAIMAEMGAAERARGHRRAGGLLAEAGAPAEQAAAHLLLTLPGDDPFVQTTLVEAAGRSIARGAPQTAVEFLRRALEESPSPGERGEILFSLGIAHIWAGIPGGAEHLEQAVARAADPARRGEIALALAVALCMLNRIDDALGVLQAAIDELGPADPELRLRLEAVWIDYATYDASTDAQSVARLSALDESSLSDSLGAAVVRSIMAFHEARVGASRARCIKLGRRALAGGLPYGLLTGLEGAEAVQGIFALICAEDVDWVGRVIEDALADARRRGDVLIIAHLRLFWAMVSLQRGDLAGAEEDLRSAELDLAATASLELFRTGYLAVVLAERGEIAEAGRVLADLAVAGPITTAFRLPCQYARAFVDLAAGRAEAALDGLMAAGEMLLSISWRSPAWFPWRSQAALALHRLGRAEEARRLAAEEAELARRWGAPRTLGITLRALGLVEQGPAAERALREAVDVLAPSHAALEHARALIDLGAMLRRANHRREAQDVARQGMDLAYRAGASGLVRQAQEELAAMGARPRTPVLTGVEALTGSERRVVRLAADGLANKEIAQALFVTVKAVEVHLTNAYRKLDIRSRVQLADSLSPPR